MSQSKPSEMSKVKTSLAYLHWVSIPLVVYWKYFISPPGRGQEADTLLFCIGVGVLQPALTAVIRAFLGPEDFERTHGRVAMELHFHFATQCFAIVCAALALAYTYIGIFLAIPVFYLVLPAWLSVWWFYATLGSVMVALGKPAEDVAKLLPLRKEFIEGALTPAHQMRHKRRGIGE